MDSFAEGTPIEFNDFSGGLTDNFLQGGLTRYVKADNFLLTVDHKLEVRPGTVVYDSVAYRPSTVRLAGLFTDQRESKFFVHSGRNIYTQLAETSGTDFTRILGPTGNEAVSGGGIYNALTTGDFQRQIYYTSDAQVLPGKIFRDQNNAWKAVTAGMPKMQFTPNYPDNASLITACITLANSLRTAIIAHLNDQANIGSGTSLVNQHKLLDKWSLSYFQSVTFNIADPEYPGPSPVPTPAPAATDETSLYALCKALALAYEHHRNDLAGPTPSTAGAGNRFYHQDIFFAPTGTASPYAATNGQTPSTLGINAKLTTSGIVTNPQKAAAFLDELARDFYWHQLSPLSHATDNSYALMSAHLINSNNSLIKIGTVYSSPYTVQVTPNYNDFIAFANWVKSAWNKHALGTDTTGGNMHGQKDPYGQITLPDAVDFDSAALILFWAKWLYASFHSTDANWATHTRVTFDTTSGSTSIANVKTTATGAALTLPVDSWVLVTSDTFNDSDSHSHRAARVMSSGLGTAVLSRTASVTSAGIVGQYSYSWLHGAYISGTLSAAGSDVTASPRQTGEVVQNPGAIGTDLKTWIELGSQFLLALGAHEANGSLLTASSHKQSQFLGNDLSGTSATNNNPFFVPTVVSYGWAMFYRYNYTVEQNGILYANSGPPVFSNSVQTTASYPVGTTLPAFNTNYFNQTTIVAENQNATISGIPTLLNDLLTNYDTTISVAPRPTLPDAVGFAENLTVEFYRTTDGGTTFYFLDSLGNGNSTYADAVNENYARPGEDALATREVLYTSGGVLANDPPPACRFLHVFNNCAYYGDIVDSGQRFPQRIRQSIQYQLDSAPLTSYDDLEDELVGLSSTKTNPIALCKNSIYRMQGVFTSTGQGGLTHERIADAQGCVSSKSIVKTEIGLFYAGTDGFYYTDGYQVIKISMELNKTYQLLTQTDAQKSRIYGCYDKLLRRVWWAMQSNPYSSDNDVFFVFYLDYGVKPSGVFTKALTTDSWMPSSALFYKGKMLIGDSRGYLFKSDPNSKTDPKIDTTTAPANWRTVYVPWAYRSCAIDMGTAARRKWSTKIHMVGQNVGNVALQINSINDAGSLPNGQSSNLPLAVAQYTRNLMWGDPNVTWGDSSISWKYDGTMDIWRRFPAKSLRSNFKQVEFLPADVVVYKYDHYPEFSFASVNATTKTATIATPTGFTSILWPLDVVDYYIAFDTDGYENKYLITALDVTKKIITFADSGNLSVTVTQAKWQISGIKREQRMRITEFDIQSSYLGDTFAAYPGQSDDGGVGGNA